MNQQEPGHFSIGRAAGLARLLALLVLLGACSEESTPEGPPDLPASETLPLLNWTGIGTPIAPYLIRNRGGILSSCHTLWNRPLPAGLQISVTQDRRNCQITGNPGFLPTNQTLDNNRRLTIYAGNRYGVDSVVVTIFGG